MIEQYPFYIEVTYGWWDQQSKSEYVKTEAVILMAETFAEAVGKIEEDYGNELHNIGKVECISSSSSIVLDIESGRAFCKAIDTYGQPTVMRSCII